MTWREVYPAGIIHINCKLRHYTTATTRCPQVLTYSVEANLTPTVRR